MIASRKTKFLLTTITSILLQLTTIVSGLIVPRLIIQSFGSDVNGLVNSIVQFLGFITLLDMGIGSVVQSALYKPIAENDCNSINAIMTSAQRFYTKIALILAGYVAVLICVYPTVIDSTFSFMFTGSLILIISISSFMQYYFGVVDGLFLAAEQRGYIQFILQIVTLILNVVATVILIKHHLSIHIVKLTTSLLFIIRPIIMRLFVNHFYKINRHVFLSKEPLEQKWNGIAQHISYVVLNNTDIAILTIFSSLSTVSVYSVYMLVVTGINQLFLSLMKGVYSLLGDLWARGENEKLEKFFGLTEWTVHTSVVWAFGCTSVLIIPFIRIYTNGISDANYIAPTFSIILVLAYAVFCLRLPYNAMIIAGNHYKQTQSCYIITAALNVIVSILMVNSFGLIGVAIGTLVAMIYQTGWMEVYISRYLIKWPQKKFIKQVFIDIITVLIAFFSTKWIELECLSYLSWIIMAIKVSVIWAGIAIIINSVFYKDYLLSVVNRITTKIKVLE